MSGSYFIPRLLPYMAYINTLEQLKRCCCLASPNGRYYCHFMVNFTKMCQFCRVYTVHDIYKHPEDFEKVLSSVNSKRWIILSFRGRINKNVSVLLCVDIL